MDSVTTTNPETDIETETQVTSTQTPSRVSSTISGNLVTLSRGDTVIGCFDISALPAPVGAALAAMGLRDYLIRSDDPAGAYAALAFGTIPGRKAAKEKPVAKPRELSAWRQAWAWATAEAEVKAGGGKTHIGKNPTAELKMALDDATQRAATLDAKTIAEAKTKWQVVMHWERLVATSAAAAGDDTN